MIYKAIDKWNTPYLEHKNGFKYIAKKLVNGTYRYFYTNEELQAFLNDSKRIIRKYDPFYQKEKREKLEQIEKNAALQKQRRAITASKKYNSFKDNNITRKIGTDSNGKKYVAKQKTSGYTKYFYSDREINDYLNNRKNSSFVKSNFGEKLSLEKVSKSGLIEKTGHDDYGRKYIAKIETNGYVRYFYSEDELNAYKERQKYLKNEPSFMKDVKKNRLPVDVDTDTINVNPNYTRYGNPDYQYNCAECTMIYELRRRGYDVESNGVSGYGVRDGYKGSIGETINREINATKYNSQLRFAICFDGAKTKYCKRASNYKDATDNLLAEIKKNPPNSRGDLSVAWRSGGAHSVVWEIDSRGNVTIKDAQVSGSGTVYKYDPYELISYTKYDSKLRVDRPQITRTDNLKLNRGIKKIIKNGEK